MNRAYIRALAGMYGSKTGNNPQEEEEVIYEFGPGEKTPLLAESPVPEILWEGQFDKMQPPDIWVQALDDPMMMLLTLGVNRVNHALPKTSWSDDELLNWLGDRDVPIEGCTIAPRKGILAMSNEELLDPKNSDWIRWAFPIQDATDEDEASEFSTNLMATRSRSYVNSAGQRKLRKYPRLTQHFLFRYDCDKTDTLRCHTYQNLERFWNLIGFEAQHPDPANVKRERTYLQRIGKPIGDQGPTPPLDWQQDDKSPIPKWVSRCLRHLKMIGFAYEAELTYFAIGDACQMDAMTPRFRQFYQEWWRVRTWQTDIYLQPVLLPVLTKLSVGHKTKEQANFIESQFNLHVNVSPISPTTGVIPPKAVPPEVALLNKAHEDFIRLAEDRNEMPFPRQPARDQWADRLFKTCKNYKAISSSLLKTKAAGYTGGSITSHDPEIRLSEQQKNHIKQLEWDQSQQEALKEVQTVSNTNQGGLGNILEGFMKSLRNQVWQGDKDESHIMPVIAQPSVSLGAAKVLLV
ncbi:hypothetical protein FN846DRAFT_202599 [Sphaerosporella brunnea]|uniref:Uncharacterized protein n=1 Tax=Sphaerosporella brunnea TaxID=1250544 RepID=A0A5J5F7G8_9PEZI|nr:hypothetical protein FN846DRAFT_202599 [Sphaerosporella brunnea]